MRSGLLLMKSGLLLMKSGLLLMKSGLLLMKSGLLLMKSAGRPETLVQQRSCRRTGLYRSIHGVRPGRGRAPHVTFGRYGKTLDGNRGGGSWVNPPLRRFTRTPRGKNTNGLTPSFGVEFHPSPPGTSKPDPTLKPSWEPSAPGDPASRCDPCGTPKPSLRDGAGLHKLYLRESRCTFSQVPRTLATPPASGVVRGHGSPPSIAPAREPAFFCAAACGLSAWERKRPRCL